MAENTAIFDGASSLSGTALAYIGDAVFEVCVRRGLIALGIHETAELNRLALLFVKAASQSDAIENILPLLTNKEDAIFKRGRNANGISAPKSASIAQYRRATGFEALFGYLYLHGENDRIDFLFNKAFEKTFDNIGNEAMNK